MWKIVGLCLLMALPLAVIAVENSQVMYAGGTVETLKEGALGNLVTTSPRALTFEASGNQLVIPFANIESYEFSEELARHLGVLPAVGTGLVRHRQKRHYLRISYKAENNAEQIVVFEVPKQMPRVLLAILQVRAPGGCQVNAASKCSLRN